MDIDQPYNEILERKVDAIYYRVAPARRKRRRDRQVKRLKDELPKSWRRVASEV